MMTLYADQIRSSPNQGIMHKAEEKSVTRVAINLLAELSEIGRKGLCHPHVTLARRARLLRAVVSFRGLQLPSMQPHLYTYLSSPAQYTIKGNA